MENDEDRKGIRLVGFHNRIPEANRDCENGNIRNTRDSCKERQSLDDVPEKNFHQSSKIVNPSLESIRYVGYIPSIRQQVAG
jgi:hypothetical protein